MNNFHNGNFHSGFPQMSALLTASDINQDGNWYPDSGATNHITHNLNNLTVGTEYTGSNQVQVRNGACLLISHFGHSSFKTSTNHVLYLNNLLHVPKITKNLISVSQFAKDNYVFFEFRPSFCCVKDRLTGKVLLKGTLHEGLYQFNFLLILQIGRAHV